MVHLTKRLEISLVDTFTSDQIAQVKDDTILTLKNAISQNKTIPKKQIEATQLSSVTWLQLCD